MVVLLVDDDEGTEVLLRRAFHEHPELHLLVCARSAEALALALEVKPVLILQDINMPGISGFEMLSHYRREPDTRDVPVVIFSGNEDPAAKSRAFALGANDYIVKLPDRQELIARTRYHVQSYLNLLELRELQADLVMRNVALEDTVRERTAELAAQMKRLESACRTGRVALWDWDILNDVVEWPIVVEDMLGVGKGAFAETNVAWEQAIHPEDRARFALALENHLRNGAPYREEYRVRRSDGAYVWVRDTGECTRDADGKPVRMFGSCVDITDRRKTEDAVRESEYRYRALVDSMAEGVVLAGADGEIIAANAAAERILGRSRGNLLGCLAHDPLWQTVHEDGSSFAQTSHPTCVTLKTGEAQSDVVMGIRRPDGTPVWLSVNSRALKHEGEALPYAAVVTFHDITRQRDAEHLRVAKEAAEMSNRAKSAFLANMSHELRTPLNAVIGFSDILEQEHFGPLNEKQHEYVADICASGKHLLSLINDILDLSKIEAGKMDPEWSLVNLEDLLSHSTVYVREKCFKHGIKLNLEVGEEVRGLTVTADERRLKQVMYNLLSNAAKFTPDGGSILVSAAIKRAGVLVGGAAARGEGGHEPSVWVEVSVADTGIGIPAELHARVFEEFYQVKGERFSKTPGTGLGLALVRQLVAMHGGRVWVESEGLGKGSRFTFTIPVDSGVARAKRRPRAEPLKGTRIHDVLTRAITDARNDRRPFAVCKLRVEGAAEEEGERIVELLHGIRRSGDVVVDDDGHGFFVLLRDCSPDDGRAVSSRFAQRLRTATEMSVACSVASYPDDGRTADAIVRKLFSGKEVTS